MGVPYIHAEGEAEALCALLNIQGVNTTYKMFAPYFLPSFMSCEA